MKIKTFLSALLLMVSSMASAQKYLNVKLEDGTYRSFKATPNMEISFDKTAREGVVVVNGYKVTVKLADDTPASEVAMFNPYVEGGNVKIEAFSKLNHGLGCSTTDDNAKVSAESVTNGFYTFKLSNVSKDMVVTIGYINVWYDLNNSGMNGNFTAKPEDIKKIDYNATIKEPDRLLFSDKYGFRGWYKDKECTEAWVFSTGVTKSMTLYAKWTKDPAENKINGHDFVKLGGYYWATENVGEVKDQNGNKMYIANDVTYGYYYNYGNAIEVAKTWNNERSAGYSWTLPSKAQWQALIGYCDWAWKNEYEYNGKKMKGMLVTGKADNYELGHSIFLPAAGSSGYETVDGQGIYGDYWSSTPNGINEAYDLGFDWSGQRVENYRRYIGSSVRAVLAEE